MFARPKLKFNDPLRTTLEAKWGEEMMDEGFVPFPKRLLRSLGAVLPKSQRIKELQMLLAIADYLRPNLLRGPSIAYLSFLTGMTGKEVHEALKRLREKRLIEFRGSDEEMEISNEGLRKKVKQLTTEEHARDEQ